MENEIAIWLIVQISVVLIIHRFINSANINEVIIKRFCNYFRIVQSEGLSFLWADQKLLPLKILFFSTNTATALRQAASM